MLGLTIMHSVTVLYMPHYHLLNLRSHIYHNICPMTSLFSHALAFILFLLKEIMTQINYPLNKIH